MAEEDDLLQSSLQTYKQQLCQVEAALLAAGEDTNDDLLKLQDDLKELIAIQEESLLDIKKKRLLSAVDEASKATPPGSHVGSTSQSNMDEEFAAFQACLGDDLHMKEPSSKSEDCMSTSSESSSDDSVSEAGCHDENTVFKDLIGSKCRAPFSQSWGHKSYHDAMVLSAGQLPTNEEHSPTVKVLFMHPIHRSMVPCQYFLDNKCSFEDDCRYSHGHEVKVEDLKEYVDHDHGELKLESKCLVKYSDRVWYPAIVVDVFPDHTFKVMFDSNHEVLNVNMEDILPTVDDNVPDESDSDSVSLSEDSDCEDDLLPVYLWRPGSHQTTEVMGGWEQHTKGIASKLMTKMGYKMGEGLGRYSKGRIEPVPIQLLPQGKSLDKIMELKEIAGDRDLYDVLKKHKHHQKKVNKQAPSKEVKEKKKDVNVFEFINKKLVHSDSDQHKAATASTDSSSDKKPPAKHISQQQLKEKSDKGLNIQLFQTFEEIKSTEREIGRLKANLNRNADREPKVASHIRTKLASMESYLQKLKHSEKSLQKHKQTRKDSKKLTIF